MTLTIGSDTGKRYAAWCIAHDRVIISADLIKMQEPPNTHGPTYRQGPFKQPVCDLGWRIGEHIKRDICLKVMSHEDVEFIAEIPTSKDKRARKMKSEDLMFLAITAGAIGACMPSLGNGKRVRFIPPYEWKGQETDLACWNRIEKALTEDERKRVGIDALKAKLGAEFHHAFESVGIVLWSLFRI